jgi:predicted ABC-type ATPase
MLARLRELAAQRVSFGFETTLASRSFAPWLQRLATTGYAIDLVFLWLPSAEFALERVAERVRSGGHDIPPHVVRRRYASGLRNLFALYASVVNSWRLYDSSGPAPRLVAARVEMEAPKVYDQTAWAAVLMRAGL